MVKSPSAPTINFQGTGLRNSKGSKINSIGKFNLACTVVSHHHFPLLYIVNACLAHHLQVRYTDVEGLVHIGVPDHPHIGDIHSTEVTLHGHMTVI